MSFYESIAAYYDDIFPLNPAQLEMAASLLRPGERVLDVGCATGGLALGLAERGFVVLGIDLDGQLIEIAQKNKSAHLGDRLVFEKSDMLAVGKHYPGKPSQLVVTLGNTLVHLRRNEIKTFVSGVYEHLGAGGHLLIQIINYDRIVGNNLSGLPTIDNDKITFVRKYDLSSLPQRLMFETKLTIKHTGETIENSIPLTPLLASELQSILEDAGFAISAVYGNFKGEQYTADSYALVVVADKPDGAL